MVDFSILQDQRQPKLREAEDADLLAYQPQQCLKRSESGDRWDSCLDLFSEGQIFINLYDNIVSYTAGETVSGTIDIGLTEAISCQRLTLQFIGQERSHLSLDQVVQPLPFHRDTREIVQLAQTVVEFYDSKLDKGQYQYTFCLYLPDWLPDSFEVEKGKERFLVEYTIRAQLTPLNPAHLVTDMQLPDRFKHVSLFRGSRKINVF